MPMLSDGQLAELRATEQARMDMLADIVTRTRVVDESGGTTVTTSTVADVPCYRQAQLAGNTESEFGGRLVSGLQWLFVFPHGTAISNDDEIVQGAERFAVMGVLGPRSFELARRVIAVER